MGFPSSVEDEITKAVESATNAAFHRLIANNLMGTEPNVANIEKLLADPRGAKAVWKAVGGGLSTPGAFMGSEVVLDLLACAQRNAKCIELTNPNLASTFSRIAQSMEEAIARAKTQSPERREEQAIRARASAPDLLGR